MDTALYQAPLGKSPYEGCLPAKAEFTIGTENTNAIAVTVELLSGGVALGEQAAVDIFLASDPDGNTVAVAPDGGIVVDTGTRLWQYTTNVSGKYLSNATGNITITMTESTAKSFYVVVIHPDGSTTVSSAITFA